MNKRKRKKDKEGKVYLYNKKEKEKKIVVREGEKINEEKKIMNS